MKYLCKQFTPDFFERLEKQIEIEVNERAKEREIPADRNSFYKSFERHRVRDFFNSLYTKPIQFSKYPEVVDIYRQMNLYPAEFIEITLESKECGFQSMPRVEWNGEIKKIDEVNEIFSYKII